MQQSIVVDSADRLENTADTALRLRRVRVRPFTQTRTRCQCVLGQVRAKRKPWKGLCGEEVVASDAPEYVQYVHRTNNMQQQPIYTRSVGAIRHCQRAAGQRSFPAAARGRIMMKHAYTRASKLLARMLAARPARRGASAAE
ncbi:hypothetical protein MTO96_001492 [Rhipicephalus appendiculatus]